VTGKSEEQGAKGEEREEKGFHVHGSFGWIVCSGLS